MTHSITVYREYFGRLKCKRVRILNSNAWNTRGTYYSRILIPCFLSNEKFTSTPNFPGIRVHVILKHFISSTSPQHTGDIQQSMLTVCAMTMFMYGSIDNTYCICS